MFIPSPLPAPSPNGQSGWYLLNESQRASAWNDVGAFHTFVTSESWIEGHPGGEWFGEGPQGYAVAINELMLGDVIQYDWDGNGVWDHAAIVVNFVGADPYVATHTPDDAERHYTAFAPSYNPNVTQIRFIHIEQSNGYTPVKTKITQGSDDAGINPTGCAFSATNNEVYLGSCFSGGNIISGFRFNNIQIPQGATIKYAFVTFTVDGTYTVPVDVQIYGEDAEDSATFSAGSPPSSRSTPYSPVLWNITDTWSLGLRRTTPQLSSVIQNIINRSDWLPGYSLSVIVKNVGANVRRVIAIERSGFAPNLSPAKLIAAYEYSGPPISSLTFNSVGSQDGWVLESTETSSIGGSLDANASSVALVL